DSGSAMELRFTLRPGGRINQYVALVTNDVGAIAQSTRFTFDAWADRPMRISVQLRAPAPGTPIDDRWLRTVYVDQQKRTVTIPYYDMRKIESWTPGRPQLARVRWLMFVIDAVNTLPGTSGRLSIGQVRLER